LVYSAINGKYDGGVIHHIDYNKLNNNPDNLQRMAWEDHTKLHMENCLKLNEYAKSEIGRAKSKELMNQLWAKKDWKEQTLEQNKQNGLKVSQKLKNEGRLGFQAVNKEVLSAAGKKYGSINIKFTQTKEAKEKRKNTVKVKFATDQEFKSKKQKTAIKNISDYNNALKNGDINITDKQRESRRINALKLAYNRFNKDKYANFEEYLKIMNPDNHKVMAISECGYEDVYDITVDNYHNFALSAGVFAHNCVVGYNDATQRFIVRNSWGLWGDKGYCYMPYSYLCNMQLADDFWTATFIE
jgi:dCTP deaminase